MSTLRRADDLVGFICKWGVIGCLLGLFFLLLIAVIVRMVPVLAISGYDEVVEWLFAWMTFLGALALWREGSLYRVVMLEHLLPPLGQRILEVVINLAMLAFALTLAVYGFDFMRMSGETTPFLRLEKGWWYAAIPVCASVMALYSLVWLWRVVRGKAALDSTATLIG